MGLASLKLHLAIIKDKSVDTFEQNKRFLLASFRNFKKVFFVDSLTPLSPPSMLKYAKWTPSCGTNIERVEMWILETKKLTSSTKQVFFGECLNYFCPWLKFWDKLLKLKEINISLLSGSILAVAYEHCLTNLIKIETDPGLNRGVWVFGIWGMRCDCFRDSPKYYLIFREVRPNFVN